MTDEELQDEARRSQEMAKTILQINGKKQGTTTLRHKQRPSSASHTFVPPKLGSGTKSRKIVQRAWEQRNAEDQQPLEDEGENADVAGPSGSPRESDERTELRDELNPKWKADQKLLRAMAEMQEKYEKNLSVIAKLFSEKQIMEEKIKKLEQSAARNRRYSSPATRADKVNVSNSNYPGGKSRSRVEDADTVLTGTLNGDPMALADHGPGDQSMPEDNETFVPRKSDSPPPPSYEVEDSESKFNGEGGGLTALQASVLFDRDGSREHRSLAGEDTARLSRQSSRAGRSSSAGSRRGQSSLVLSMQADIDR